MSSFSKLSVYVFTSIERVESTEAPEHVPKVVEASDAAVLQPSPGVGGLETVV